MRSVAVGLTKQGLEAARAARDQGSDSFFSLTSGYYNYNGTSFGRISGTVPTMPDNNYAVSGHVNYYRVIQFTASAVRMDVTVTTYWQEGSSYNYVDMATVLTKWR